MSPLVSVLMPCYNSARTLPMALASLLAQTYENWECIFVDDGSTDDPRPVVRAANDPRIRYFRLEGNMGRGFARQVSLEYARGEFVAMLDADDWSYPWRLEVEVQGLACKPHWAVLSTGMAIINRCNDLVGVRGLPPSHGITERRMEKLGMPPVPFSPLLMRTELARRAGFDPSFITVEDIDFLVRVMLGRFYGILPRVTYAYAEHGSVTPQKVIAALAYSRRVFFSYRSRFPIVSTVNAGVTLGKSAAYRLGYTLGLWETLVRRRSRNPTPEERQQFAAARTTVEDIALRLSVDALLTGVPRT